MKTITALLTPQVKKKQHIFQKNTSKSVMNKLKILNLLTPLSKPLSIL